MQIATAPSNPRIFVSTGPADSLVKNQFATKPNDTAISKSAIFEPGSDDPAPDCN
jgi:hypothetical protein